MAVSAELAQRQWPSPSGDIDSGRVLPLANPARLTAHRRHDAPGVQMELRRHLSWLVDVRRLPGSWAGTGSRSVERYEEEGAPHVRQWRARHGQGPGASPSRSSATSPRPRWARSAPSPTASASSTRLAEGGPATSAEFAARAGIDERYAREWLSAMACHGYVAYDDAHQALRLTPEQAFCLVDRGQPGLPGQPLRRWCPPYWQNLDLLTEAFQHGGGVPQERFGDEFWCGFERFTRTGLPQQPRPGLDPGHAPGRRGAAGGRRRSPTSAAATARRCSSWPRAIPTPRLVGYDNYAPAIEAANANAAAAGLADRVRYEVCDVTQGIPGSYDLITTFDVVHDMPHPRPAMQEIKQALKPDGTYFVLEFNFSGDLQANIDHPLGIGAFGYSASINYCMTQALAVGGEGTGTCMGEEKMRELADGGRLHPLPPARLPAEPLQPLLRDPRLSRALGRAAGGGGPADAPPPVERPHACSPRARRERLPVALTRQSDAGSAASGRCQSASTGLHWPAVGPECVPRCRGRACPGRRPSTSPAIARPSRRSSRR